MTMNKEYKKITKASDKCAYHKCDGSGYIVFETVATEYPYQYCVPCSCNGNNSENRLNDSLTLPLEYKNCSIENFNTSLYENSQGAEKVKKIAENYIKNFSEFQKQGVGLYLYSNKKGSGKTRLACSIANAAAKKLKTSVKFIKTLELLSLIRLTYRKDSTVYDSEKVDQITRTKVLILDDIGAESKREWIDEEFLKLLDYRISNKLITIFTSNVHPETLKLDERIVNRILSMTISVQLPEESVRLKLAKEAHTDMINLLKG